MRQSDGSNQSASPFPKSRPPWLGWRLHELLCRTCSNNWLVDSAVLWRKKQANREIVLLACAFGPFSADLAVRVTGCYVVPAALRLRLVLLALFFLFVFPSVSESSDATQPRPPVQVRRRFVIAALISQAPETETESESFNSVISSLGRTRKRSKEASCHPGMHTA